MRLQHGLGQISGTMGTHGVSADAGLRALNQMQRFLRDETRPGIPALSHEECLLGIRTLTPDSTAKTHPNLDGSKRIAVIGPTADDPFALLSGYSFPVQVILRESLDTTALIVTPLQALRATYGAANVSYAQGCAIFEERAFGAPGFPGDASAMSKLSGGSSGVCTRTDLIADAVKAALAAALAIVFVGDLAGRFQTGTVGEGFDTDTLSLPGVQQQLLQGVVATGTPTVVVMPGARAYHFGGLEERVAAFAPAANRH